MASTAEDHNAEGSNCFKKGDFDAAYRHYTKAIKADSSVAKYWSNRANTLWRLGRARQVIEDADAAIACDPSWVKGYYFRALALHKLGDLEQAIQALQQGAAVDPSYKDVLDTLHRFLDERDAARRAETDASSKAYYSDPSQGLRRFQQAVQDPSLRQLTPQQRQQMMRFHRIHQHVVDADKLRFGSPPDLPAAAKLYRKAAELGSASGQFNYAQMIKNREITDQPVQAAMQWLLKAAAQPPNNPIVPSMPNIGVREAWLTLGDMYRDGLTGQTPDYSAAMSWYMKAADAGEPFAQNNIGQMYATGRGVVKDLAAAAAWYRKAADQGYGVAEFNLAALLCSGAPPDVPQDHAAALALARRAHQHGMEEAAALLAQLEPSCFEAAAQLKKAAEAGDPHSCLMLAQAYYEGLHGCPRDMKAANKWLTTAAVDGKLPEARLQLGLAYKTGSWGCEVKPKQAISFVEKAAYQGLAEAQLEAAHYHMLGIGTKVDFAKARQWAQKAADQGCPGAEKLLHKLREGDEKQWAKAAKTVQQAMQAGGDPAEVLFESLNPKPCPADPADAILDTMLSSSSTTMAGGLPDEAKSSMRQLHDLYKQDKANPTSMFKSGSLSDRFPLDLLMQYEHSPSVQPYIAAKLAMYRGLEALIMERDVSRGIEVLAYGYAVCHRVMQVPAGVLQVVEDHLKQQPGDAAARLVHCYLAGAMRGPVWAEKQLSNVLPKLPKAMYPHALLSRAEMRCWENIGNYEGAIKDAEEALQPELLPGNPDLLYIRAYAKYSMEPSASSSRGYNSFRGRARSSSSSNTGSSSTTTSSNDDDAAGDAVEVAFREYLQAAPMDHLKRPHAHFFLGLHVLATCTRAVKQRQGRSAAARSGAFGAAEAAALDKAQALYDAGLEAEKLLPPFFLPVECGAKGSLPLLLTMAKAAAASQGSKSSRGVRAQSSNNSSRGSQTGASVSDQAGNDVSSVDDKCWNCGTTAADAAKLMKCSRCQQALYCCRQCQVCDWKARHSKICKQ